MSSELGTAAAAMPDTAECTIAGALRLEKLSVLPQPSAEKPAGPVAGVRHVVQRGLGARVEVVLGAALELVEHPLAAQQPDRRDALPLGRRSPAAPPAPPRARSRRPRAGRRR